ncbi:hypothetical protein MPDQ_001499 [Monascus purpureus]|uniref:Rieske domain-containing protein n=1 Tax=Monascus purpureus TaxID=5098 RepID=A0A507R0L7_MONPU|nr:hypothetical protein MPDQ_001499 [Monascus purpureus]
MGFLEYAPMLATLLAGIAFLQRTWILPLIQGKLQGTKRDIEPVPLTTTTTPSSSSSPYVVSKESNFPENWWTGKDVWELERRAIFSKTWLYISHRTRFSKPGDYQSFTMAGFPIFLILGKDGKIRAFHNVCRHRAYTITKKETGSSLVLGCRYHGWSYNAYGNLVKAPHFDDVPGFDKSQNGLFEIHTRVSERGFIFVNLEAGKEVPEGDFDGLDEFVQNRGRNEFWMGIPHSKFVWAGSQAVEGNFNWKFGLRTTPFIHPAEVERSIPVAQSTMASAMAALARYLSNDEPKSRQFCLFPNTSIHNIKGTKWWYSLSFSPISESKTSIRYDLFCWQSESSVDSDAETLSSHQFEYRRAIIQTAILAHLEAHSKLEKAQGAEVFPALQQPSCSQKSMQADMLCRELHFQDNSNPLFSSDNVFRAPAKETLVW